MQAPPSDDNTLRYDDSCTVQRVEKLSSELYRQAVARLPIFTVDIFLVDLTTKRYVLVLRKTRPAQGVYWLPGGRLLKGEEFFEAARRKCIQEMGISIKPQAILGVYNLIFPDSAWECAGHTPSVLILATCSPESESVMLDEFHQNYKWVSLFESNNIDYVEIARKKALQYLKL